MKSNKSFLIFNYIKVKVMQLSIFRWLLLALFVVFISYDNVKYCISAFDRFSIFDYLFFVINDEYVICYYLMFCIIIIAADIYNPANNSHELYLLMKIDNRKKWNQNNLITIVFYCLIIILLLIIINSIMVICFSPYTNLSYKNTLTIEMFKGLNPYYDFAIGSLLILLRLIAIAFLMFAINLKCKKYPMGFIGAIIITLIDRFFYGIFQIMLPLNILPIEHTRVLYTEAVAPVQGYRGSYLLSILYWGILIYLLYVFIVKIVSRKDFITINQKK